MKAFTPEERAEWERQRDQQNDVLLRQLAEGVANLGNEPAFREYLKVQRLFHDYSPSNCWRAKPPSGAWIYPDWPATPRGLPCIDR
jgi:hypothetical protein